MDKQMFDKIITELKNETDNTSSLIKSQDKTNNLLQEQKVLTLKLLKLNTPKNKIDNSNLLAEQNLEDSLYEQEKMNETLDKILKALNGGIGKTDKKKEGGFLSNLLSNMGGELLGHLLGPALANWVTKIGKSIFKGLKNPKELLKLGGTFLDDIGKNIGKFTSGFSKLGKFAAKWALPVIGAYEGIKGLWEGKDISDKLKSMGSGILGAITGLPAELSNLIGGWLDIDWMKNLNIGKKEWWISITDNISKSLQDFFNPPDPNKSFINNTIKGIEDAVKKGGEGITTAFKKGKEAVENLSPIKSMREARREKAKLDIASELGLNTLGKRTSGERSLDKQSQLLFEKASGLKRDVGSFSAHLLGNAEDFVIPTNGMSKGQFKNKWEPILREKYGKQFEEIIIETANTKDMDKIVLHLAEKKTSMLDEALTSNIKSVSDSYYSAIQGFYNKNKSNKELFSNGQITGKGFELFKSQNLGLYNKYSSLVEQAKGVESVASNPMTNQMVDKGTEELIGPVKPQTPIVMQDNRVITTSQNQSPLININDPYKVLPA